MTIYLIILLFLFLCFSIELFIYGHKLLKTYLFFISFLILLTLSGIRYDVGVDYLSYKNIYIDSRELYGLKEGGFILITELFHWLEIPFDFFCFCFSFLTLFLAYKFILKNSPSPFFSILIYYALGNLYFSSFNAIRQSLAIMIFINIIPFILQKKIFKFILLVILTAYFVHASALLLLPIYFFLRRTWRVKSQLLILAIVCGFSFIIIPIIELSPYAIYLKFESFSGGVPPTNYLLGLISLITICYALKHDMWYEKHKAFINMNFVSFLLILLLFIFENTPLIMPINRVLGYFTMIYIIILPLLYNELKLISNRYILLVLTACCFSLLSFWALEQNGKRNNMVPYKTIFDKSI